MSKPPFFSVVIPTYNCSDFLKRALTSVFNQTYQNFEIILIDDEQSKNSFNFLEEISNLDTRIELIVNKEKICPLCIVARHQARECPLRNGVTMCLDCRSTHVLEMGCRPQDTKKRL